MGKVIDFQNIKSAKDREELNEMIDDIYMAKTAIAMILGTLEVSLIAGSVAMQVLVNKIIEDGEWEVDSFNAIAEEFKLVEANEEKET
jgi:hypothetical protein